MTVVAIGRGHQRNLLVADWVKGVPQPGSSLYDFATTRCDKILRIGNTWVTAVGDDQVLVAAYSLGVWAGGCPDFTTDEAFAALVALTDGLWNIHTVKSPQAQRQGFTLVMCDAKVAFYRTVKVRGIATVGLEPGTSIAEGELHVIYGGIPSPHVYDEAEAGLVERAIDCMKRVDTAMRASPAGLGCKPLPYPFPGRWSSVVVSTDGTGHQQQSPFGSPLAESAWQAGLGGLAEDEDGHGTPHPRNLPLR
jgi:hypothetical protein